MGTSASAPCVVGGDAEETLDSIETNILNPSFVTTMSKVRGLAALPQLTRHRRASFPFGSPPHLL